MKLNLSSSVFFILFSFLHSFSQNVDYISRITRFESIYGCGSDVFNSEEYVRIGYLRDNVITTESTSGPVTCNSNNTNCNSYGSWAYTTRNNIAATSIRCRLIGWEDDVLPGNTYSLGDECYTVGQQWLNLTPVEYAYGTDFGVLITGNHRVYYNVQNKYSTTTLTAATEYFGTTFVTGGNRPFWGSRGSWSNSGGVGGDCAASGTISHGQSSSFRTTVSCKSGITFKWKTSSQINADYLRFYINGAEQAAISGFTGWTTVTFSLDPSINNTVEWVYSKDASISSGEDRGFVDYIIFNNTTPPITNNTVSSSQTICSGQSPSTLIGSSANGTGIINYEWYEIPAGGPITLIPGATGQNYSPGPLTTTTSFRRKATDACGKIGYTSLVTITVNPLPTAITTISPVNSPVCPNTSFAISATGGTTGIGSTVAWYTGPNGSGTNLANGENVNISLSSNQTVYVRRENALCGNTSDNSVLITVKEFIYAPVGTSASSDYCTDDNGWHHFFNTNNEIFLSLQGDLSGALGSPIASVVNLGSFFQSTDGPGTPGTCGILPNAYPGNENFEMGRSWNIDFAGTLNPPYNVRFYYPTSEKTSLESAANAHISSYPSCGYTYEYNYPNGFYFFKNSGTSYSAPLYDGIHLSSNPGSVNSINYSELSGIVDFSGGSGAVILTPDPLLDALAAEFGEVWGIHEDRKNIVYWTTLSEYNSSHFEIEKYNTQIQSYETIGVVNAAINSFDELEYSFVDEFVYNEIDYYRIKEVDQNGTHSYSKSIAIQSQILLAEVFPNPADHWFNVYLNFETQGTIQLSLMDNFGRMIRTQSFENATKLNSQKINLENIEPGVYRVILSDSDRMQIVSTRFIKR